MADSPPAIGIDLGGTKIEGIALIDGTDGRPTREIARHRIATPRGDYRSTIEAVASLIAHLEGQAGRRGSLGLGIPGSLSPADGLVRNANSTWLNGRPLVEDLVAYLDRPVAAANDANCFALSEATDGAGAAAKTVFGVIIGTGVGGGIVVNGRVLVGANGISGEWGHTPLPGTEATAPDAPECWCGRRGCIETFLSGPGLARDYAATTGDTASAQEIAALSRDPAAAGEPAREAMARYEARLARALAVVIDILDPETIVLGGGLSQLDCLYRDLPALIAGQIFSDVCATRILPPVHGDSSGVRGAAWLGRQGALES